MTYHLVPPVTASAATHAGRLQARDAESTARPAGKSTAQHYADRILPGYRRDEELREQARLRELRARGVITPDPEPDADEEDYDVDEEYEEEPDVEEEAPMSTAELYARRERERQAAEHAANLRAQAGAVRTSA